jgi:hypothetical protein
MSTSVVGTRGLRASRAIVVCVVSWASISACAKEKESQSPPVMGADVDTVPTAVAHEPPTPDATPKRSMPVEHLPPRQPESAPTPLVADSIKPDSSKGRTDRPQASPTATAPTHREKPQPRPR